MQKNLTMKEVLVFTLVLLSFCHGEEKVDQDTYLSHVIADLWLEGSDVIRILWRDCSKKLIDVKDVIDHKEYFPKFMRCMKRKTLRALDRALSTDIVPIADGVNLVRYELVDKSGNNIVVENNTSSTWSEKELEEGEWRSLAMQRMAKVLRTHVIKFDFDKTKTPDIGVVEYRGRRRHQMMTMMMFGVVSIGMVVIPMGFQFLAVLGGKALLLAKMALILASIQGLKKVDSHDGYLDRSKIAASPLSYGFYHNYPPPYDPHFEKRSRDDWPPPIMMPGTPPPAMARYNPWPIETSVKIDRIQLTKPKSTKEDKIKPVTWKPETIPKSVKQDSEPRLYPVYSGTAEISPSILTSIDAPSSIVDFTTRPGEVQADYTLELPYNGFLFQGPSTVVPA